MTMFKEPANPTLPGYYTTAEVRKIFGWKARQNVHFVSKQEGWDPTKVGGILLFPEAQIKAYYVARMRTKLAKKLGWRRKGTKKLIRTDEHDVKCPECYEQAVLWGGAWECVNGHSGSKEYFRLHS